MGNDIGPVPPGHKATIILIMKGEVKGEVALLFKKDLDALIEKYKPAMEDLTRPVNEGRPLEADPPHHP